MTETKLRDLLHGSEYVLTYEDKDGDWMLVGDVPCERILRRSIYNYSIRRRYTTFFKEEQVEHSNVSKMGKKGSWFSASKRVFAHSSKENVANGIEKKNKERARESKIRDGHSFLPFVRDPVALRILRWLKGGTKLQNLSNQRQNFRLHLSKRQNLRLHLSNQRQNLLM
ncbi:uncharacterized protein LOC110708826 isoform X2 [Chenopodium quinoa]|nr:uncharacterized protein LOC110708826 isoform X2 [Chenopodium quinoa]